MDDAEEDEDNEDEEVEDNIEGVCSGFEAAHLIEDEDGEQGDKDTDGKAEEEEREEHEGEPDGFSSLPSSDTREEE